MSLLTAPPWIVVLIVAEAIALLWLAWRFGWRGVLWGIVAALGSWLVAGLSVSLLVSRLDGGGGAPLPAFAADLLAGAVFGVARLASAALPAVAGAAALGLLGRRFIKPKPVGP